MYDDDYCITNCLKLSGLKQTLFFMSMWIILVFDNLKLSSTKQFLLALAGLTHTSAVNCESTDLDWVWLGMIPLNVCCPSPGTSQKANFDTPFLQRLKRYRRTSQMDKCSFKVLLASYLLTFCWTKHTTWLSSISKCTAIHFVPWWKQL